MFLSFEVGPDRGLQQASCTAVPRLMIIGGPNGSGKSTLLELLHRNRGQAEADTHVMYVSPNRPWRRSEVSSMTAAALGNQTFRSLIEAGGPPSWRFGIPPGLPFLNYQSPQRGRDFIDDSQSLVKAHIINLERRRQRAITALVDEGKRGAELDFDAFEPLRRYVQTLLPHLRFGHVDMTNDQSEKVYFEKLDALTPFEIELDDLSSGEKAVVALMFPFIESQAENIMVGENSVSQETPTVLIDEPELHLHPALQSNLVAYLRELSVSNEAQFILCTHSTTIIDSAAEGELFVLTPPATTGGNQLLPVASSQEKLEMIRELTGSAYTVTRCRPIVYVEGETVGGKAPADQRVLELLVPESKSWVLVPAHGRDQAIRAATDLRQPALTGLPGLLVFALVDSDQGHLDSEDWVIEWEVAMQENLLLDADALWEIIQPHLSQTTNLPKSKDEIIEAMHTFTKAQREHEIELRVRNRFKRLSVVESIGSLEDFDSLESRVSEQTADFIDKVGGRAKVAEIVDEVSTQVDELLAEPNEAIKRFHGKELLDTVFTSYAGAAGWSGKAAFAYNLASVVARVNSDRLQSLLGPPIRKIQNFVPSSLVDVLRDVASFDDFADVNALADSVAQARADWEAATDPSLNRIATRAEMLSVARRLQASGHADTQHTLIRALAEFAI
jgi:ABC-type cobalamin/Fe3+-siderophores transport system ATPase subunit